MKTTTDQTKTSRIKLKLPNFKMDVPMQTTPILPLTLVNGVLQLIVNASFKSQSLLVMYTCLVSPLLFSPPIVNIGKNGKRNYAFFVPKLSFLRR